MAESFGTTRTPTSCQHVEIDHDDDGSAQMTFLVPGRAEDDLAAPNGVTGKNRVTGT
jgi:hypothetical protein